MRACLRCRRPSGGKWKTGPDGFGTLCAACNSKYVRHHLPIFRSKNNRLTIKPSPGAEKLRVIGFQKNYKGHRNQLLPLTAPFTKKRYLYAHPPITGKRIKRESREGHNFAPCSSGASGCSIRGSEDKVRIGEKFVQSEEQHVAKPQRSLFAKVTQKKQRDDKSYLENPTKPSVSGSRLSLQERPFSDRIRALKESGSLVERIDNPKEVDSSCGTEMFGLRRPAISQRERDTAREQVIDCNEATEEMDGVRTMAKWNGKVNLNNSLKRKPFCWKTPSGDSSYIEKRSGGCIGVPVKATLRANGSLVLRRFSIRKGLSYFGLKQAVLDIFGSRDNLLLRYLDDCGDFITISSDVEVAELYDFIGKADIDPLVLEVL